MTSAPPNKFRQLSITHALMIGGDAAMVVALADSFFFDVDPSSARSKLLAFLLVSFAPFVLIAPLIGPAIDRISGGRRAVVQIVAGARIATQVLMMFFVSSLGLFPLVFVALVLQKTYTVSKQALVPSVVTSDQQLVEANSKLGVIAGIAGAAAVVPAGILQIVGGGRATLAYSALIFAAALVSAFRLPRGDATLPDSPSAASNLYTTTSLQVGWAALLILRAMVGFMLFHLAFLFRDDPNSKLLLGVAVAMASAGTMIGNLASPRVRRFVSEEHMLTVALLLPAGVGLASVLLGGSTSGVVLVLVVNLAAALGRLSFESIVQRDGLATNRGEAFAQFETRFQLGWVIAAIIPVMFDMPAEIGYLLVGVVGAAAAMNYVAELNVEQKSPRRGRFARRV